MNIVILIGRTGKDVELITTPSGAKIAKTSLATTEKWTDDSGQRQERTSWHNLNFFGRTAEVADRYIRKGDVISVTGKISYSESVLDDGTKRYYTNINVEKLELLPGNKRSDESTPMPKAEDERRYEEPALADSVSGDDDLPF